jgi:hypothetical protein
VLGDNVLVELLQASVLGREAALGGRVNDQDDLALVLVQVLLSALLCAAGKEKCAVSPPARLGRRLGSWVLDIMAAGYMCNARGKNRI